VSAQPSSPRGLYLTFVGLSALSVLLGWLLLRPAAALEPVRGAPAFELDEPPPGSPNGATTPLP
jgi:hypothetical protein